MMSTNSKRALACHEAGHAVISWRLGVDYSSVEIVEDAGEAAEYCGTVTSAPFYRSVEELGAMGWHNPDDRRYVETYACTFLAGPLAEKKCLGQRDINIEEGKDAARVLDVLQRLFGNEKLVTACYQYLSALTEAMLENPAIWRSVQMVAEALSDRLMLTHAETQEIIAKAFISRA